MKRPQAEQEHGTLHSGRVSGPDGGTAGGPSWQQRLDSFARPVWKEITHHGNHMNPSEKNILLKVDQPSREGHNEPENETLLEDLVSFTE